MQDGTTHLVWSFGPGPLYNVEGLDVNSTGSTNGEEIQWLLGRGLLEHICSAGFNRVRLWKWTFQPIFQEIRKT